MLNFIIGSTFVIIISLLGVLIVYVLWKILWITLLVKIPAFKEIFKN